MNIVRNLNLRAIYFETAIPSSVINKKSDGTDFGDVTYTMHDAVGNVTTDVSLAVRTSLDVEPAFDFELEGGWVDLDSTLAGGTSNGWFFSVLALPDIPESYGGSVQYVGRVNLEMIAASKLMIESQKTAMMIYSATQHTNKIRAVIHHPVGVVKRFQIYLEMYA